MNTDQFQTRLEKLERSNRHIKLVASVAIMVLAGLLLSGAAKNDRVLELDDLTIHDKAGNERIRLTVDENGPYMRFVDSKGRPRALLIVQDDSSIFRLQGGPQMKSNISLINSSEPGLSIVDNEGKTRAVVSTKAGVSRIILTDNEEHESVVIAGAREGPSVALFDAQRKLRGSMTYRAGISQFSLFDSRGAARASAHAADDSAAFAVTDENEIRRAAMVDTTNKGGALAVFGKYGEPSWTSPSSPEVDKKEGLPPSTQSVGP